MASGGEAGSSAEISTGTSSRALTDKRPRSAVWHYFTKLPETPGTSRCSVCSESVKHASNTSNLYKHLKSKHPEQYKEAEKQKKEDEEKALKAAKKRKSDNYTQVTFKRGVQGWQKYSPDSKRRKQIDQALLQMLASDMQPASVVEDVGFQSLVHLLDPRYQLPSRRTLMRMLPDMYSKRVDEIKQELAPVSHVALTSDIWTSRTTQSYLTLTCHFLTPSWELKSLVLETFDFNNDHTAGNIAEALQRVVESWEISGKIVAIVTNNAANIVAAVRLIGWMHIPCFAHTLNLVVTDAIKADARVCDLKKRCKQIVTFHHSVKATEKLKEIQGQLSIPDHKLIQEVETRWNSTYFMFERMIEQHQAVTTALCLANRNDMCLTSADVDLLKAAVAVLMPFEATTREVSADKYVSISKVIPLARSLQHLTSGTDKEITLVTELTGQLRHRFTSIENAHLLAMSTLLDPRMKKLAFRDSGAVRQGEQWIIQEMAGLAPADTPSATQSNDTSTNSEPGLWDLFDAKVTQSQTSRTGTTNATVEARKFFEQQVLPRKEDPLSWWRVNEGHYTLLSQLARKYLCIPGTSVPAERLFSKAGELVSIRRNRLKPKHVNMFLFLNQNA